MLQTGRETLRFVHKRLHALLHRAYLAIRSHTGGQRPAAEWVNARPDKLGNNVGPLAAYVSPVDPVLLAEHLDTIAAVSERYLRHQFDLLGSGWVEVKHGMVCRGFEGYRFSSGPSVHVDPSGEWLGGLIPERTLSIARHIWTQAEMNDDVDSNKSGYTPVDWQLDFKSGYRWSEQVYARDIRYGDVPGADMKVPWELGRMQHLIQFAWAYVLSKAGYPKLHAPGVYAREFKNQILDFIATNPPGYGVQWKSTMDVAIRISNWLIVYDLFRAYGETFDTAFNVTLVQSVYAHGLQIVGNLEWSANLRHNHYLADIVGLLFVAAYLPVTPQIETWLAFAREELLHEVQTQFHVEGTNFEGSTCYHRLSSEMVVYATALLIKLISNGCTVSNVPAPAIAMRKMGVVPWLIRLYRITDPDRRLGRDGMSASGLPLWYFDRLIKMAEFTMHVTKPNGQVIQIGDNDSGRFLKAMPEYQRMRCDEAQKRFANLADCITAPEHDTFYLEDHLSHRHLVAAIYGLFPRHDFATFCGDNQVDTCLIRALTGRSEIASHLRGTDKMQAETRTVGTKHECDILENRLRESPRYEKSVTLFDVSGLATERLSLTYGLRTYAYPEFGVYIFKSSRLFLAIRCGLRGREGQGGHDHNDQLSIEIAIDGVDWIADPGTYIYSALPERRNQYRSVKAHFAPRIEDREPAPLDRGLFALPDPTKGQAIYFGPTGFAGVHYGYRAPIYRFISLDDSQVTITDYIPRIQAGTHPATTIIQNPAKNAVVFSPGYGILVNSENVGPKRHGTENIAMTGGER